MSRYQNHAEFLASIDDADHRAKLGEVLEYCQAEFPELEPTIKWNQPMFIREATFIVGFSVAKAHMSVAFEPDMMAKFAADERFEKSGYSSTNGLFRIKWNQEVDWNLLRDMLAASLDFKRGSTTFWA